MRTRSQLASRQSLFCRAIRIFTTEAPGTSVDYGLTCSIWTNDLTRALRTANAVEAGYVWINEVSKHFLGAPFGGYKQSGIGREECLGELLSFTQEKNIHVNISRSA